MIAHCCLNCVFFDDADTDLPTCLLLRKLVMADWSCDRFEEA